MPNSLIDVEDFKTVLGVGDLYPDADLERVTEAATSVLLAYLVMYRAKVDQACCTLAVPAPGTGTTVRFRTTEPHKFFVGQEIVLRGFGIVSWDRTVTVTEVPAENIVIAVSEAPWNTEPIDPQPIIPNGTVYDGTRINYYADVPEVVEAATAIAVDMWQSRLAPGGQMNAVDFTPGPIPYGQKPHYTGVRPDRSTHGHRESRRMSTVTVRTVREDLAEVLTDAGYQAYAYPPAVVQPPSVVILPDEPYLEIETIGSNGTRLIVRLELVVAVQAIDNEGSLDALEKLAVSVLQLLPQGTAVSPLLRPTVEQVGPSDLLTTRIPIEVRAQLSPTE